MRDIDNESTVLRPSPLRGLLPADRLMSIAEVAQVLSVDSKTIRRRIKAGELPSYRIGSITRLHPRDVEALFAAANERDEPEDLNAFVRHQINGRSHGSA